MSDAKVKKVGVVGGGTMGSGIARSFVDHGCQVRAHHRLAPTTRREMKFADRTMTRPMTAWNSPMAAA